MDRGRVKQMIALFRTSDEIIFDRATAAMETVRFMGLTMNEGAVFVERCATGVSDARLYLEALLAEDTSSVE